MISLHEPAFDERDEASVLAALRSTWVSTSGEFIEKFECAVADFVGCKYAVAVVNGTAALHLAVETLRRQKELCEPFEVIVPSLSFAATANAVVHAGGCPVFVDTAPGLMNIDPSAIWDFINAEYIWSEKQQKWRSKSSRRILLALIPVHVMGWSCPIDSLQRMCQELNIALIEDAAEALGSYGADGRHLGRFGLAGIFSFNGNKIVTTGGGGMIITDNEEFARRVRHLGTTAKLDGIRYLHDEVGYNFRLVNLLAALGCSQIEKLPKILARKRDIFLQYKENLMSNECVVVHQEPNCESNNWLINVVFENTKQREAVMSLLAENQIAARPLWTPFHRQPSLKQYVQPGRTFPNTEDMWGRCLSLPSSPSLSDQSIHQICSIIKNAGVAGKGD